MRTKKVENGATTYYLRSTVLGGQIVAELSGAGAFTRGFVYAGGELLAVQQNNQVNWVHQEPGAKSKRVTNNAGTVVSTIELDPWGGDTNRSNNEAFQPRRFTTYDRDGNASDEAMHRRYNRWHSRFDQPDPYGGSYDMTNPQSFNRYSYVQNDPVNFVDPMGLCPEGTVEQLDARGEKQCVGVGVESVDINISGGGQRSGGVGGTSSGAIEIETSGNGPSEAEIIPQDLRQIKEVTDCDRFAAEVARLGFANSDNLLAFVGALRDRFAKEGSHIASTEFASSGFKDQFKDPDQTSSNQPRHYVGAFRAAVLAGLSGRIVMTWRERPKKTDSPETTISHKADLALNQVAFKHAGMLTSGRAKITELQILILKDVCE